VLKKKSSGPTIGKPSLRSRQLFFMACYDIDRFREFVFADSFAKLFELKPEERESFANDDVALLQFAFRFLRQVMFGEESIALNAEAAQERLAKVQEKRLIEEARAGGRAGHRSREGLKESAYGGVAGLSYYNKLYVQHKSARL
jgi:hypothetical protein